MTDSDSMISADSTRQYMKSASEKLVEIAEKKKTATKDELIALKKDSDHHLGLMKIFAQLQDLHTRMEKIKADHPDNYHDGMTEHGLQYSTFYRQAQEISTSIAVATAAEYNEKHKVT